MVALVVGGAGVAQTAVSSAAMVFRSRETGSVAPLSMQLKDASKGDEFARLASSHAAGKRASVVDAVSHTTWRLTNVAVTSYAVGSAGREGVAMPIVVMSVGKAVVSKSEHRL